MDSDDLQALADALAADLPQARVDTRRDIVAALSRLTAQQRDALAWHYMAQATLAETAVMMGLRTDNTKRILDRARQLLRTGLPDYRITATPRREHK
jgi:DNA-directed RNA polymerase specialized sigma24 family protein